MLHKPTSLENDFYSQFGRLVKLHRCRMHLTQQDLSERLNLSRSSIANIELGRQKVLLHQLFDLAEALNLKPLDLLPTSDAEAELTAVFRAENHDEPVIEWAKHLVTLVNREKDEQATR